MRMKRNEIILTWVGKFLLVLGLWGFIIILPAEAAVTVTTFQAPVEVLLKGEKEWKPVEQGMPLNAGDQILTGQGGTVDLEFEDGSTLSLDEETQLGISELEFSEAKEVRVSRLNLFWGAITAVASPLRFKKNVFEVETETVVAGFKFSSMRIIAKRREVLDDSSAPRTKVLPLEGKFEMLQIGNGLTEVEASLEGAVKSGIAFKMRGDVVVEMEVDQVRERERIVVKSDHPLMDMRALLSEPRNVLRVKNTEEAPIIEIGFQQYQVTIEDDSTATFAFAPEQAEQKIGVGADGIDGTFVFGRTSDIPLNKLYVGADIGSISINGEKLDPGTARFLPIEVGVPVPGIDTPEIPGIPPPPKEAPPIRTGSPILPQKP